MDRAKGRQLQAAGRGALIRGGLDGGGGVAIRTLVAGVLGLLLLAGARPAAADCKLMRAAALPVTMLGAQPTIEVKLNDAPVRLMVDSGAFFSTLSTAGAAQLGLKTTLAPFGLHVMGVNGEAEVSVTKVRTFGLAGVQVPNVEFLVGGGSLEGAMGLIGVMGRNVLNAADVEYDFAHGEIRFLKSTGCGGQALAYWSQPGQMNVLAMSRTGPRDTSASTFVKVNGAPLRAVFDTGASTSILTRAGARKARLDVDGPGAVSAGATTGLGRRRLATWLVPVDEVRIGDELVKHTRVRVGALEMSDVDMLVGADFFLSHRVLVSNSQQRIYFTYNGGPVFDLSVKPGAAPPPEPAPTVVASAAPPPGPPGAPAAVPAPPSPDEPKDADGYSRRGQAFVARRDYARALADLSRAVELDPQNARFLRERAQLRLLTRQPFLAMADLDAVLKLTPDDAEAHLLRAGLRGSGRDRAGQEADLDAADKAAPKQADLRLALGSAYTRLGSYERAVAQYDAWLASHDGDSRKAAALNGRCWARALGGRELDQAQRDCDAALRLQPRTPAFLDSRGLVELRRGETDRARADYDAALASTPKLAFSLYGRGVAKLRKGDAEGGRADIAAATALDPGAPELARRAGVAP